MPSPGASSLDTTSSENIAPGLARHLARSPHPYLRQHDTTLQDVEYPVHGSPEAIPGVRNTPVQLEAEATYFDADHRKRRKQTSSPSDSGTEADDERGGTLLKLPAPPKRLTKGLKGANNAGTASPLLTPSYLDDEPRRLVLKSRSKRREIWQDQSCTDEETIQLREKFKQRRQAELIRRTTETILAGVVGFITCSGGIGRLPNLHTYEFVSPYIAKGYGYGSVPLALLGHATVVTALYTSYPLRIIYKNHALSVAKGRSPLYIHIPAAFDPAPLLYPIFVPVFVALSLFKADPIYLLPNLILSVASIPSKIIPSNTNVSWYSSPQWLLSAVPILAMKSRTNSTLKITLSGELSNADVLNDEILLLLYPLHQVLLPVLGHLTTTSLLPAELQLLSVSMINLLLHAKSPQSIILQSLLWIGGLSIFVLCGKTLTWGVALARVPSWRFRKHHTKARGKRVLFHAIDDCFHGRLTRLGIVSREIGSSDDSEDDEPQKIKSRQSKMHRKIPSVDTRRSGMIGSGLSKQQSSDLTLRTLHKTEKSGTAEFGDVFGTSHNRPENNRQRRSTLPFSIGSAPADISKDSRKRSKTTQFKTPKSWSLRSFTEAQAIVIKWGLAFYVYAVIIAITTLVVRKYVGCKALHGQEPVGWALGYLFGDVPSFRQMALHLDLDSWIPLPEPFPSFELPRSCNVSTLQDYLGAYNIRLAICGYCIVIISVGLVIVFRLSAIAEVDTRRKVFHGMMVVMFLPTVFVDPSFVSLAFSIILAIFLLLDLFRASQLPPLSRPLTHFLAPYVDGRDHRGPVIVSHIFLLIGCAIPLWLSLAAIPRKGEWPWEGWDVERREVSMISGIVCVGMGDAAASLIGRRFGRRRWCWSGGKSLEGSLAFAIAVVLGLSLARFWLVLGGWNGDSGDSWATTLVKASIAASGASLTEAVLTGGNDNIIVPVILWLLVRGLEI